MPSPILLLFLLILGLVYFYKWLRNLRHNTPNWKVLRKIPGPRGYPLIGTGYVAFKPPDEIFRYLRKNSLKYYPIYKEWSFHRAIVHILHPEDIKIILADLNNNKKFYQFLSHWLNNGLLTSTGRLWQYRRKLLTPAFHFNILQEFVRDFNRETEIFLGTITEGTIEVTDVVSRYSIRAIKETAMGPVGVSEDTMNEYNGAVNTVGKLYWHRFARPWLHAQDIYDWTPTARQEREAVGVLHKFTKDIMKRKELSKGNAMLDLLLKEKENGNIDDDGIREEVDNVMFAGYDTTATAIGYILMLLANNTDAQEKIVQEIAEIVPTDQQPSHSDLLNLKYMDRCVKECLRLYPSVPFLVRKIGEDIQLSTGYTLPKNSVASIQIYDVHHNPNIYPDPERFDPDRFLPENTKQRHPFAYIPFSAGPRNCIGQKLAMLEIKALLVGLLRKYVLEPIDTPETITITLDLVLRSREGIKIKFTRRCKNNK